MDAKSYSLLSLAEIFFYCTIRLFVEAIPNEEKKYGELPMVGKDEDFLLLLQLI